MEKGIKFLHSKLVWMPRFILLNFSQKDRELFIVLVSFFIAVCKNWIRREEGYILSYLLRGSIHHDKVNQSAGVGPRLIILLLKSGKRQIVIAARLLNPKSWLQHKASSPIPSITFPNSSTSWKPSGQAHEDTGNVL